MWNWMMLGLESNRVIGLRWLTWVLRRDGPPADAGAQVRDFYTRFYHRTPSDEQIAALLRGSGIGR